MVWLAHSRAIFHGEFNAAISIEARWNKALEKIFRNNFQRYDRIYDYCYDNVKLSPQELWVSEMVMAKCLLCMESAGAKSQASSISASPSFSWMAMCCHFRKVFPSISSFVSFFFFVCSCFSFLRYLFEWKKGALIIEEKKSLIRLYVTLISPSGGQRFHSVTIYFFARLLRTHLQCVLCCIWWRGLYWKVERLLACGTFTEFSKALNSALIFYGSISWWRRVQIKVEQLWKTHSIFHLIFIKRMRPKRDGAMLTAFVELQRRAHTQTQRYVEEVVDEHTAWITIRWGFERIENEQRCEAKNRGTSRIDFIMCTRTTQRMEKRKTPPVALMADEGCACNQNHWKFSTRKQIRDFTREKSPREPIYSWRTCDVCCVGVDAYLQNYYITKTVMSIHCWFSICHVHWNLCNSIYVRKLRRRSNPGTMGESHRKVAYDIYMQSTEMEELAFGDVMHTLHFQEKNILFLAAHMLSGECWLKCVLFSSHLPARLPPATKSYTCSYHT